MYEPEVGHFCPYSIVSRETQNFLRHACTSLPNGTFRAAVGSTDVTNQVND